MQQKAQQELKFQKKRMQKNMNKYTKKAKYAKTVYGCNNNYSDIMENMTSFLFKSFRGKIIC